MDSRPILLVSHRDARCGIFQFGKNLAAALSHAQRFEYQYVECGDAGELAATVERLKPRATIYNHHVATMPWLNVTETRRYAFAQIGIFHEVTQSTSDAVDSALFDYTVAADPTLLLRNPRVFKTGRYVEPYVNRQPVPAVPTIGSFGFATGGKGFERLVREVHEEFDEARIRLQIPYSHFGDRSGEVARASAQACREIVTKPGIQLEIGHDFLSTEALLDFLAQNSMNAFLYDDVEGRGISSVVDYALAVGRPLAVSTSSMFRHVHDARPGIVVGPSSLKEILHRGNDPLDRFRLEWTPENLAWDYDRIVAAVLDREASTATVPLIRGNRLARTAVAKTVQIARRGLRVGLRSAAPVLGRISPSQSAAKKLSRVGGKLISRLEWLGSTHAGRSDWIPNESVTVETSDGAPIAPYVPSTSLEPSFNRILDDNARRDYQAAIEYLGEAAPGVIVKKIARANVQQAFVLDTVARFAKRFERPRLLCVGSYEDTASLALIAGGQEVFELDPVLNYDITTYASKPTPGPESYDIVFSTSVIEHVVDDEAFAAASAAMLAPGGFAVFTCDFREDYQPGDPIPREDRRFYTTRDLRERILPAMVGCRLVDEPTWENGSPDFSFGGCLYSFATFVVEKSR